MNMISKVGLIVTLIGMAATAGCTGARISLEHFSEGYGNAPPAPRPGGSGPPQFQPPFGLPTEDFTIPSTLPELLKTYRLRLVEMGRPLAEGVAEQYADAEIAALKRQYSGKDSALQAELTRRLQRHPVPSLPEGIYPVDEEGEK